MERVKDNPDDGWDDRDFEMSQRDIIREGIADNLEEWMPRQIGLLVADTIMRKQSSQGVVIKVDRKLPSIFLMNETVMSALEYKKKLAGYEAVEPLIKGE